MTGYRPLRIGPAVSLPAGAASAPAAEQSMESPKRSVDPSQAEEERSPVRRRLGEESPSKRKHEGGGEEEQEASQEAQVVDVESSINELVESHHDECVCVCIGRESSGSGRDPSCVRRA